MALKVKERALPQSKPKQRLWRKGRLKESTGKKKKTCTSHPSLAEDTVAWKAAQIAWEECPQGRKLTAVPSTRSPDQESALKKTKDNDTQCSLWMPRPTGTRSNRLWKALTLTWPRSYPDQAWWREGGLLHWLPIVMLCVANKTGLILTESSWQILNAQMLH